MINLKNKHILAIDYGSKKLGVSSFNVGIDPYPLLGERIVHHSLEQIADDLKNIIDLENINLVVLGIPYLTDGTATKKTKEVLNFKNYLMIKLKIDIYEQDETLSTREAKDRMKNSPRFNFRVDPMLVDSLSACIILEDFMECNKWEKTND